MIRTVGMKVTKNVSYGIDFGRSLGGGVAYIYIHMHAQIYIYIYVKYKEVDTSKTCVSSCTFFNMSQKS